MPTLRTVTVKSAGGDYSSLSAAEAGEQGDLVSLDRQLDIECYSMADTTAVVILGWTTDATRYVRVYTPTAERHDGKWNTAKYRLSVNTGSARALRVQEEFVRLEGLQLENTNAGAFGALRFDSLAAAASCDCRVDACVMRNGGTSTTNSVGLFVGSGKVTINNCVITGTGASGIEGDFVDNAPTVNVNNCSIGACGTYGIKRSSGTFTVKNTYSGGNTTDAYSGTITFTTCAHDTATVFAGSTASVAYSTSNFTNVTAGSEDLHLAGGASATLTAGGTDLSGTFTADIDGETRSAPWSIGADQPTAAPSGQPTWKRFGGIVYAARGTPGVW